MNAARGRKIFSWMLPVLALVGLLVALDRPAPTSAAGGAAAAVACPGPVPNGASNNTLLAVTVPGESSWRPRGAEVRLDVTGLPGAAPPISGIQVCFEWAEDPTLGLPAANIRRLTAEDGAAKALNTVSFAAEVPDLPDTASQWWTRIATGAPSAVGLATVPLSRVVVKVTPADGEASYFVTKIGVTSVAAAVVLVALLLALCVLLIEMLAPKPPAKHDPQLNDDKNQPLSAMHGSIFGRLLWVVTADDGFASLSQFQIILWTITVAACAVYVMTLSGNLIDIPNGMLQLLGIAGGAALLARVPVKGGMRQTSRADTESANWSDLVVINGNLDVTRLQMLIFTLISAAFVILKVITGYQIAEIPSNFVLLMGISNGVYLTGRHLPDKTS